MIRISAHRLLAWSVAALLLTVGCSPSIKSVPVSGRVTLNGQPLADVALNFSPVTGGDNAFAAYGKTDKDGKSKTNPLGTSTETRSRPAVTRTPLTLGSAPTPGGS